MKRLSSPLLLLLSLLLSCLTLLSLPVPVCGGSLFDSKLVIPLGSDSFRVMLKKENSPHLVAFCAGRHAKCRELSIQYNSLARQIKAEFLTLAQVDCKESKDICQEQGVTAENQPIVRLFVNKKVFTYKGELKTSEMNEWVWKAFPNHVQQMTVKGEKKNPRDTSKARVILFTDKRTTGPLYKSLALTMKSNDLIFAEVRKSEKKLLDHYGIGKTFPVIMIEPPVVPGEDEKSARRFEGKFEKAALMSWIQSFLPSSANGASSSSSAADGEGVASTIPELVDQSCLEKYCSGPLCMVMFLAKDHPELPRHLATLSTIERSARSNKQIGRVAFVYADSMVAPHAQKWMENNFDLQVQDYPQFVLLAYRKGRYAPYVGTFSPAAMIEFLTGVSKGAVRTIPFATTDKKLQPLPDGTACPPETKEETKSSSSSAGSQSASSAKTPVTKDEGELYEITSQDHDTTVLKSPKPWVLLFHSGESHAATHPNLTAEFQRVAVNMKDMVMFGSIDVSLGKDADLAKYWGVDPSTLPVVISVGHRVADKTSSSVKKFEGDLGTATARDLRAFSQTLLAEAKVMVVNAKSMQEFMGQMEPNLPFSPKFLLFVKPASDGTVVVPDMVKSLALEFGSNEFAFGIASSRERDLARQFSVTKIPAAFVMGQDPNNGGVEGNQIRVTASPFGGNIVYSELQQFCQQIKRVYDQQKLEWIIRAAQQQQPSKGGKQKSTSGGKKPASRKHEHDEHEHVDLDEHAHDEL